MKNVLTRALRCARRKLLTFYGIYARKTMSIQKNKIVFLSFYGKGYSCNPKYIAEELMARKDSYDLVWLREKGDKAEIPSRIRVVQYESMDSIRELASARIWVTNVRGSRFIRKKAGQYLIQTWHSSLSPKRVEADVEDELPSVYVKSAIRDGAETDLMFANNSFRKKLYSSSFWYKGPVLRCGVPRNQPLFSKTSKCKERVFSYYGIPENKKLCLYAPTFRKTGDLDVYKFDYIRFLDVLSTKFGGEFIFAMRLHPNIAHLAMGVSVGSIVDATDYPDVQELVASADVMVSDYSSILEDFALLRRPGFVFAPDYDEYIKDRGFYYPPDIRPFPFSKNEEDLISNVLNYSPFEHIRKIENFFERFDLREDGKGASAIADVIDREIERTVD